MEELEKQITGHWFDIKSVYENPVNLRDYFDLGEVQLKQTASRLHNSVEEGITGYKKNVLKDAFKLARALEYDTSSLNMIKQVSYDLNSLLYVILFQRLLVKRIIKPRIREDISNDENEKEEKEALPSFSEINSMVKEIQEYARLKPQLKSNRHIINILLQVSKYQKELETMKKILPNIPNDKKENFKANYIETINDIFLKLINSYKQFSSEYSNEKPEKKNMHPLEQYDLGTISELLKNQAETVLRIKTTFDYTDKERFKILDYAHYILSLEKKISEFIEKESTRYYNAALSETGKRELSRIICIELSRIFERQAEASG